MTPDDITRLAADISEVSCAVDQRRDPVASAAWKRVRDTLAQQQGKAGGVAWECTGDGLKRYVTDKQYRAFTPAVQRWYKPYRCANCAAVSPQTKDAT